MTATNWYWIDGTAYCPACVECDTPAVDVAVATRGPCEHGRCGCCGSEAMTRSDAIARLQQIQLGEDIGIGGYAGTAAYKLANGDISQGTPELDDETRGLLAIVASLDWAEIGGGAE